MSLDYSQLSTYQVCPERYRLRYVEALKRLEATDTSLPMIAGQALHEGLRCLNVGQSMEQARVAMAQMYAAAKVAPLLEVQPVYQLVNLSECLKDYHGYVQRNFPEMQVLDAETAYTGQDE